MERPKKEELANGLTHALGTVLSILAGGWLIQRAFNNENFWITVSCAVYAIALVAVYFSSAMSHWEPNEVRKLIYRRLDQAFIYILIVASYTPFSAAFLSGTYFTILLATMWMIAIGGFFSKLWLGHRLQTVAIWAYLGLGWMTVLAFLPRLVGFEPATRLPVQCVLLIVMGGVFYSAGTWFLFNDKKRWYFHAIWHVFVLLGSIVHFWAIAEYVT